MSDDLDLERELRRAAGLFDPVPPRLRRQAVGALALRAPGAELAEIVFDSLLEHGASLVRGVEPPRLLTFRSSAVSIDVELINTGRRRRLLGQLDPAQPAEIELCHPDRSVTVRADELGRFAVEDLPAAGPFSIRWRAEGTDRAPVVTDWVVA